MLTRFLFAVVMIIAGSASGAENRHQPTVVSINVCADQLVLALADSEQILGLSAFSTDAGLSYFAERAQAFTHDLATAEQVVEIDPDLVLAGRFTRRATRDMLKRLGYEVFVLDPARNIDDSIAQIGEVAALLGQEERGRDLIAEIRSVRTEAEAASRTDRSARPSAALYQRRGWMTGGGTLSEELMALAGFTNAGETLAGKVGGFVPLERLIANPPDYLFVSEAELAARDQGSALLAHPALTALFPPEKRVVVPTRLTVCAGPSLPEAIRTMVARNSVLEAQ